MSPSHWKRTCIEHTAASFDTLTTGSVALGPTSVGKHPFLPNLSAMNLTAWEQWVFDATADDGVGTIMVGLCRDPNYSFFGQGNLHMQFFAALGDSKPIQDLIFLDHSTTFDCGDYVAGHWASASKGYDFRFTVDQESSITALQVTSPRFRGNLAFAASEQGHRPDGSFGRSIWAPLLRTHPDYAIQYLNILPSWLCSMKVSTAYKAKSSRH